MEPCALLTMYRAINLSTAPPASMRVPRAHYGHVNVQKPSAKGHGRHVADVLLASRVDFARRWHELWTLHERT